MTSKALNRRLQRMALKLQEDICYLPGGANANADALSWKEWEESAEETGAIDLNVGKSAVRDVRFHYGET